MSKRSRIGSAILGFFAAIRICEEDGYDWRRVAELVERETQDTRKKLAESAAPAAGKEHE